MSLQSSRKRQWQQQQHLALCFYPPAKIDALLGRPGVWQGTKEGRNHHPNRVWQPKWKRCQCYLMISQNCWEVLLSSKQGRDRKEKEDCSQQVTARNHLSGKFCTMSLWITSPPCCGCGLHTFQPTRQSSHLPQLSCESWDIVNSWHKCNTWKNHQTATQMVEFGRPRPQLQRCPAWLVQPCHTDHYRQCMGRYSLWNQKINKPKSKQGDQCEAKQEEAPLGWSQAPMFSWQLKPVSLETNLGAFEQCSSGL